LRAPIVIRQHSAKNAKEKILSHVRRDFSLLFSVCFVSFFFDFRFHSGSTSVFRAKKRVYLRQHRTNRGARLA
jgi:hypothetical protein